MNHKRFRRPSALENENESNVRTIDQLCQDKDELIALFASPWHAELDGSRLISTNSKSNAKSTKQRNKELNRLTMARRWSYVGDRLRSIRQDLSMQRACCARSAALLVDIARVHSLVHWLLRFECREFSLVNNRKLLSDCLVSLRLAGALDDVCASYLLALHMADDDAGEFASQLVQCVDAIDERRCAAMLRLRGAFERRDFVAFFRAFGDGDVDVFHVCILLECVESMRADALALLNAQCRGTYALVELAPLLGVNDGDAAGALVRHAGLPLTADGASVRLHAADIGDCTPYRFTEEPLLVDRVRSESTTTSTTLSTLLQAIESIINPASGVKRD
jgi:SAC3/GANP family